MQELTTYCKQCLPLHAILSKHTVGSNAYICAALNSKLLLASVHSCGELLNAGLISGAVYVRLLGADMKYNRLSGQPVKKKHYS